jgi:NADH:ubiquinone oxidoreductase subunit 4 (subunit M)
VAICLILTVIIGIYPNLLINIANNAATYLFAR